MKVIASLSFILLLSGSISFANSGRKPASDTPQKIPVLSEEEQMALVKSQVIAELKRQLSDLREKQMLDYGVRVIAENTKRKVNQPQNQAVVIESEKLVDYWGDCFYRSWKIPGMKAAAAARNVILSTPEKVNANLYADQAFKFKRQKIADVTKEHCLKTANTP